MNGIIIIDKPSGWTSHDVVGKLRGLFHEKRIGHGGTLDPMATGVLPVFMGRATRAVEFCENAEKEYIAGLRLGISTDTQDITGSVIAETGLHPSENEVSAVLDSFRGDILQLPPMYSAIKKNGQKLYELARRGVEVERQPRPVTISLLDIVGVENGDIILRVVCSKGTYVRTLCNDIGEALGCGGVMSSLRRTRAGAFTLEDAVTIEEAAESTPRPVDSLWSALPRLTADGFCEKKIRVGADYPCGAEDGKYRVYSADGGFLMLGQCAGGVMHTIKSFFEV